jgi:hypothetical protein
MKVLRLAKHEYCVYYSETKEQFACAKTERAKRFELLVIMQYMTKEKAKDEAALLNRNIDNWRDNLKEM